MLSAFHAITPHRGSLWRPARACRGRRLAADPIQGKQAHTGDKLRGRRTDRDIGAALFREILVEAHRGPHSLIVQNMDGAGGLIGAQIYGRSRSRPPEGTVSGLSSGSAWLYVSDPRTLAGGFRKYECVAYQPGTTVPLHAHRRGARMPPAAASPGRKG